MAKPAYKKRVIVISVITTIISAALLIMYLSRMNNAIEGMTISNIRQLAAHDVNSIRIDMETAWNSLEGICTRLGKNNVTTIDELFRRLDIERSDSLYDEVILLDSSGYTYSSSGVINKKSNMQTAQKLFENKDRIVFNDLTGDYISSKNEIIAYGIKVSPMRVENAEIVAVIGYTPVIFLEKQINIKSYDGAGLSSVFDRNGYYLINPEKNADTTKHDNYFDVLVNEYGLSRYDISKLKERLYSSSGFYEIYSGNNMPEKIVYYEYMPDTDWIFCTSIPTSVVSEEAQPFVRMTLIAVIVLLLIIMAIFFVIIRFVTVYINANAKAKAHGEFLSNMSHELRTPLNAIIGFNEIIQNRSIGREKAEEYLRKSGETARYMLSLINDILDMSKLQSGTVEIENTPFSLSNTISTLEAIIRGRMDQKDISFTVESEILSDVIIGDETHIEQIMINILGNAAKFTPDYGKVTFRVYQKPDDTGKKVTTVFETEDNGIGISKEFQEKIFDAFSQERSANRESIKGTGLGMSLSYMFARAMGGDLTVSSTLGEGSTFRLTLTNEISDEQSVQPYDIHPEQDINNNERQLRILVAEDNDLNAEILIDTLELENIAAERAENGQEAVEKFKSSDQNYFDLIIMDIQMPVMDGYEATKAIRALERPDAGTVPIFACSANTFKEDKDEAYKSGMNDFITKPIDLKRLMEKISRLPDRNSVK